MDTWFVYFYKTFVLTVCDFAISLRGILLEWRSKGKHRVKTKALRLILFSSNYFLDAPAVQAVCVTTHKVSWVKLLLCLISIVTRSSSHLVKREMNQTQGSKHCFHYRRERFGEFSRSHSGLRCLLLASQDNFNKFIAIRRRSCDLADFERRLISCFWFYVLFGLYVYFYLIVKEICSSYLDLLN